MNSRINAFIKYKQISVAEFEKRCGLSNGAVAKMGNNTRLSTIDKISMIFPEINTVWLRTGEGEMLKSPKSASVSVVGNDNAVNNSNCQISRGNTANGALDSLQAENTALRKEIAELRSALLDLTRQNQRLMDKLLSLMDGPNTSTTAGQ